MNEDEKALNILIKSNESNERCVTYSFTLRNPAKIVGCSHIHYTL